MLRSCFESMWRAPPPESSHSFLRRRREGFASVYNGFAATQLQAFRCVISLNKGKNLSGKWHKVHALSESLDPTADLFELSFVARQGAKLATTVVVDETDEYMKSSIKVRHPARCRLDRHDTCPSTPSRVEWLELCMHSHHILIHDPICGSKD